MSSANTSESMASVNFKWGVNYLSWPNGWPIVSGTNSTQPLGYCTLSSTTSRVQTSTIPTTRDQTSRIPTSKAQTTTTTASGQQTFEIVPSGYQESFVPTNSAQPTTTALSQNHISTDTTSKAQPPAAMGGDTIAPAPTNVAQTSVTPNLAPSYVDTGSVTAFPTRPVGVCSITSIIYMFTSTIWVHPGDHRIPPPGFLPPGDGGGVGGFRDGKFGCVPVTKTVHL